jgi:hypothetical protein
MSAIAPLIGAKRREEDHAKTAELGGKMIKRGLSSIGARSGDRRLCRTARDNREHSMKYFRERQTILWSLLALLLLSDCTGTELECDSLDTRSSVIKIISDDSNNALVDYAAKNSSAVEARVNNASTEAEKSAIWEKARQGASYRLGDTIATNSKSKDKRAVTCSALLSATVEDATAHKQVDFKVEQTADGKMSVSVSPFQFSVRAR